MGESHSYLMPTYSFLKKEGLITESKNTKPVVIEHVAPGSLADKAGITGKQKILSIADVKVTTANLTDILGKQFGKTFSVELADDL